MPTNSFSISSLLSERNFEERHVEIVARKHTGGYADEQNYRRELSKLGEAGEEMRV